MDIFVVGRFLTLSEDLLQNKYGHIQIKFQLSSINHNISKNKYSVGDLLPNGYS